MKCAEEVTSLKIPTQSFETFYPVIHTEALSDLSTAEESLSAAWVYLKGFLAIFQGLVWIVQAEGSEGEVQEERKLSCLDALLLRVALDFPAPKQHRSLGIGETQYD